MSNNGPNDVDERDYIIPDNRYRGDLQGGGIRHNATFWKDEQGNQHRESYNYDKEGNMENFHDENGPK